LVSAAKVMVWLACVTWKLWLTGVAAAQLALPDWEALMVQVPAATRVTVVPDRVQADGVAEANVTVRPEEALALTANGDEPKCWLDKGPKAMVWAPGVTWKVWLTGVAADQLALPGWLAWMVQAPAAAIVTVVPDTVQVGVVAAKATAKPELAVAVTANGAEP
jgi:energy-converting hydrogenase Eha subunit G